MHRISLPVGFSLIRREEVLSLGRGLVVADNMRDRLRFVGPPDRGVILWQAGRTRHRGAMEKVE